MDPSTFTRTSGTLVSRQTPSDVPYYAFVPNRLPPPEQEEAILRSARLLADANHALGQLDGVGAMLPNPDLLVRPYMRREAVRSSRIEGTQASFTDLVAFEATDLRIEHGDVREVYNYVDALDVGLQAVRTDGLSLDVIRRLHRRLVSGVRGEAFGTPGEFRHIQNHIGNTRDIRFASFVPPPPDAMFECLDHLEAYLDDPGPDTPILVEMAWAHYQFETIHPFLDGNGRVGRLLLPLILAHRRRLEHPLLYLSSYFESRRNDYYDLLFAVSARSAWNEWLQFFLEAVLEQAREGVELARKILALHEEWRQRLLDANASANAHRTLELVGRLLALDARTVERELGVATQTAYSQVATLEKFGILGEITGRASGRIYVATELLQLFDGPAP